MIETTTPLTLVQDLPLPDPQFRVEPYAQLTVVMPASIEVFDTDNAPEVQWASQRATIPASAATSAVLEEMIAASEREAQRNPRSARSRVNYGVALMNAGRLEAASLQFEAARDLDPISVSALAHLARARLLDGRVLEARGLAEQVRDLDSSNVIGLLLSASADIAQSDLAAAAEALQEATRLKPDNWLPQYLLGVLLIRRGLGGDATKHLRSASRNLPRSAAIRHAMGVAFGLEEDWRKAMRSFREALALAPRRRESVLALAHVYLRQDASDEAIALLSDWAATSQDDRETQELLAHSYRTANNHAAARRHLHTALRLMSADEDNAETRARILNNIGVCTGKLGDFEKAAHWYARSIDALPTSVAFRNLAEALRQAGDLKSALRALGNALVHDPDDTNARIFHGVIAAELGYAEEAIATLKDVIHEGKAVADAYASLGWVLSDERRDYPQALAVLAEGHKLFATESTITNNLAYVNLMLGNMGAARDVLAAVPASEIEASPFLMATMGLLRLYEGDFTLASGLYKAAERLARGQGRSELAKTVRQKMHLEFARAYLRINDIESARDHAKRGLAIEGRRSYRDDLRELRVHLITDEGNLIGKKSPES